ncbi:hypothetical protein T05_3181 [Trichinella murrelli]|uniref:Uncharacterized protein n=1 Tax=Trichinella murrelli TaxID=144512 RepID=A0A0V0TWW7_9BILA|nr:hypothetical protein T05_3181 [Trichinella murrelli]
MGDEIYSTSRTFVFFTKGKQLNGPLGSVKIVGNLYEFRISRSSNAYSVSSSERPNGCESQTYSSYVPSGTNRIQVIGSIWKTDRKKMITDTRWVAFFSRII